MAIDMNLISLKDGGRFAMSWIAGTNPKALRSNFQRHQIYSIDVPDVCEEMMDLVKANEDKPSFRILFRLCFGTVNIYAEQVQHLYDVTLNFVCFNTFVMKQYSRKRLSSTVDDGCSSKNKRRCFESSDDIDISSLLLESEIFNNYTEDKFHFPNELGHDKRFRKQNSSTCIQINQITIRHVSWDNQMPEEQDAFGDASQDERSILLSGLSDSLRSSSSQKRKTCYSPTECSPFKRPCLSVSNETVDDVRFDLSIDDTIPEAGIDSINETTQESEKNTIDFNDNDITQIDFESTRDDHMFPIHDPASDNQIDDYTLEDDIPLPDELQEYISRTSEDIEVDDRSRIDSPDSSCSLIEIPRNSISTTRKRKQSQIIIDTFTKIPRTELNNIWKHCYDPNKVDHLASAKGHRIPIVFNKRIMSGRLHSEKLLSRFNKNVKLRSQQNHDYNRQLIVEEILGDDFEEFKSLFNIKTTTTTYAETSCRKRSKIKENNEKIQQFDRFTSSIIDNNNNNIVINDENNNIRTEEKENHIQVESNCYNPYETKRNDLTLNCSLDEIDPFAISFDFPDDAGNQRSEWGKQGIMLKLLFAWISEDSMVNMKSIICGANRINAALAFHTLLSLSGQHYIEIVKDKRNSIECIKMGPEMIKKINESFA